jgi:hypothetical protein
MNQATTMFDRKDHAAMQQERIKKLLRSAVRREYLRTRPSFAARLFSGDMFGLSLRPDITNDQSAKFIKDAEWALFDAWVDVGHAMSAATRDYGIAHGLLPGSCEESPSTSNTHEGHTP